MVTYETTTLVPSHLVEAFERYMREHHVPEGVSTSREVWVAIQRWDAAPGAAG